MANDNLQQVSLDSLAAGKLPERVIKAISEIQITMAELARLEASRPKMKIMVTEDHLMIETRMRLPMKKLVAMLSILGGFATIMFKVLPALQTLLK